MKSCWKSKACGNPLCVFLKRSLSGYHTQGNLPAYTKFFTGKNVLDIQQLQANQIDINSTVSSHLLGSPAQSCMKACRAEPNHSGECFPCRLLQVTGKMPGGGVVRSGGSDASSWPHRVSSLEASCPLWILLRTSHWEPVSFTHLQPLSSVPGRNDGFQLGLQHTHDNSHKD